MLLPSFFSKFFILLIFFLILTGAQHKNNCIFYNYMMKGPKKITTIQENTQLFSQDIIHYMMKFLDLKTIINVSETCHFYKTCYRNALLCKSFSKDQLCSSLMCRFLPEHFDVCTNMLRLCAQKYDKKKDVQAKELFMHLWRHHAAERFDGVADVLKIQDPSIDECLSLYAGNYQQEFLPLIQDNDNCRSSAADSIKMNLKKTIMEANSLKLKIFLYQKNIIAVKTMLLGSPLLDYGYNGWLKDDYNGDFRKRTLGKCIFDLNDTAIIVQLIKNDGKQNKPFRGIWWELIFTSINYNHDELLKKLICMQYDIAFRYRFSLWNTAMREGYGCAETIGKLLFNDSIEVVDENYGSLVDIAIVHKHAGAVRYLLTQGIKVNTVDKYGRSLLYKAFGSIDITKLLLAKDADANKADQKGKTPLMALPQRYEWNKTREEVFYLLLKYGANVNIIDNEGKTVLHYFANLKEPHNICNYEDAIKMIPVLLEYGADRDLKDKHNKTPLDYAVENNSIDIINLLAPPKQKEEEKVVYVPVTLKSNEQHDNKKKNENKKSPALYKKIILYSFGLTTSAVFGLLLFRLLGHFRYPNSSCTFNFI